MHKHLERESVGAVLEAGHQGHLQEGRGGFTGKPQSKPMFLIFSVRFLVAESLHIILEVISSKTK